MRKLLVLLILGLVSISCDFATESAALKPDIEVAAVLPVSDTAGGRLDVTAKVTAMNSVDCTIEQMLWEYWDTQSDTRFFGPFAVPVYVKIPGVQNSRLQERDTFVVNLSLVTDTVLSYLITNNHYQAKAVLSFIAYDDYSMESTDTAIFWIGLYRLP